MFKKLPFILSICTGLVLALPILASADSQLYTNGGYSGGYDAYYIGPDYYIADSFTIAEPSIIDSIDFTTLSTEGTTPTTVDWVISDEPFGGVDAGSGLGTALTTDYVTTVTNPGDLSFDVYDDSFETGGTPVDAGTYYLELGNAAATDSGRVYWNETDGDSTASVEIYGGGPYPQPSGGNAFTVNGYPVVPEASTSDDMLLGLVGLAAVVGFTSYRRRSSRQPR